MASENIKVCVRARPLNDREAQSGSVSAWVVEGNTIRHNIVSHALFTFGNVFFIVPRGSCAIDHVFDEQSSTEEVYEKQGAQIVQSVMEGINGKIFCALVRVAERPGTIFAYGQTSSGKTFTMQGSANCDGIITRAVNDIFKYIQQVRLLL
jgi:centromeric protein E